MSTYLSEKEEFINHVCREAVDKFKIVFLNTTKQHVLKSQELELLFSTLQDELKNLSTVCAKFYEAMFTLEDHGDIQHNYFLDAVDPTRKELSTLIKDSVFLSDLIDAGYCFVNNTNYGMDGEAKLVHNMITAMSSNKYSLTNKLTDKLLTGMIQIVDFNTAILTNIIKIPYEEKKH